MTSCNTCHFNCGSKAGLQMHLSENPRCLRRKGQSTAPGAPACASSTVVAVPTATMPAGAVSGLSSVFQALHLRQPGSVRMVQDITFKEVVPTVAKIVTVVILVKVLGIVIDLSASMEKEGKVQEALNGARSLVMSMNQEHDYVALFTFGSSVVCNFPLTRLGDASATHGTKGKELNAMLSRLMAVGAKLGDTRFYDAAIAAADALAKPPSCKGKRVQYEMVLLTDGADNCSSATAEAARDHLRAKKADKFFDSLHVTALAVGMSAKKRLAVQTVVDGTGEVHDVSERKGAIKDTFKTVVQQGIETRTRTVHLRLTSDGRGGVTPSLLPSGPGETRLLKSAHPKHKA